MSNLSREAAGGPRHPRLERVADMIHPAKEGIKARQDTLPAAKESASTG